MLLCMLVCVYAVGVCIMCDACACIVSMCMCCEHVRIYWHVLCCILSHTHTFTFIHTSQTSSGTNKLCLTIATKFQSTLDDAVVNAAQQCARVVWMHDRTVAKLTILSSPMAGASSTLSAAAPIKVEKSTDKGKKEIKEKGEGRDVVVIPPAVAPLVGRRAEFMQVCVCCMSSDSECCCMSGVYVFLYVLHVYCVQHVSVAHMHTHTHYNPTTPISQTPPPQELQQCITTLQHDEYTISTWTTTHTHLQQHLLSLTPHPHTILHTRLPQHTRWLSDAHVHAAAVLQIAQGVLQFEASRDGAFWTEGRIVPRSHFAPHRAAYEAAWGAQQVVERASHHGLGGHTSQHSVGQHASHGLGDTHGGDTHGGDTHGGDTHGGDTSGKRSMGIQQPQQHGVASSYTSSHVPPAMRTALTNVLTSVQQGTATITSPLYDALDMVQELQDALTGTDVGQQIHEPLTMVDAALTDCVGLVAAMLVTAQELLGAVDGQQGGQRGGQQGGQQAVKRGGQGERGGRQRGGRGPPVVAVLQQGRGGRGGRGRGARVGGDSDGGGVVAQEVVSEGMVRHNVETVQAHLEQLVCYAWVCVGVLCMGVCGCVYGCTTILYSCSSTHPFFYKQPPPGMRNKGPPSCAFMCPPIVHQSVDRRTRHCHPTSTRTRDNRATYGTCLACTKRAPWCRRGGPWCRAAPYGCA